MTPDIGLTIAILVIAVGLFATNRIPFDLIGVAVLVAVFFVGLIPLDKALSGFANNAIITIGSVYVISEGLSRTGVAYSLGQLLRRIAGGSEARLITLTMLTVGGLSGFMNAIGAAAVMLPAIVAAARAMDAPVSRVLLPLSYGALMGSMLSLVGTPANLLVNSVMVDRGFESFQLFDFTPVGAAILAAGIVTMVFARRWLLPDHAGSSEIDSMLPADSRHHEPYQLEEAVFEVEVPFTSNLVGQTVAEANLGRDFGVYVFAIARGERLLASGLAKTIVESNDHLLVSGQVPDLDRMTSQFGLGAAEPSDTDLGQLGSGGARMAEVVVAPRSDLIQRTLPEVEFTARFGLNVLAVWREGVPRRTRLAELRLQQGDTLLVQGPTASVDELRQRSEDLVVISQETGMRFRRNRAPLSIAVLALFVIGMVTNAAPVAIVALAAAGAMVVVGAVTMDEARTSVSWRAIILIGGMLAMAEAMTETGAAEYLARSMVDVVGGAGWQGVLAVILILTSLFAIFVNNHVAAVLMAPLAIDAALNSGGDPRMFIMAVALGAATGYATPFAHPGNILVMGPGNYRFNDFVRAGVPVALVVMAVGYATLLVVF
ncbi:MAG: SLC13 family permease [Chloroflexi bacterium]|nr:SLC13 family permease [Chloroflexota bacterium]MXY00131.1 SLC13 family permease [Chloroflexota bacterium]